MKRLISVGKRFNGIDERWNEAIPAPRLLAIAYAEDELKLIRENERVARTMLRIATAKGMKCQKH